MKINELYNCRIDKNNMTYSIDMLRVKTYMTYDEYNSLDFYMRTYYKDKIKRFWISDRPQCFRYNWNIEVGEGKSFYFGFCHNSELKMSERLEPEYNFTVDFNPNKLKDNSLIKHLLSLGHKWYIVQFDIAVDLKVNIMDLIIDKSGKRKYMVYGQGLDNKTYTLGSSGGGHIKIYNKKVESNISMTGGLTRVEVTVDANDFFVGDIIVWNYSFGFPEIYLNQYVYSLSDMENPDKTTLALLFAVQNGYSVNDLTKTYRKKIKDMLQGGYKIRFEDKEAKQVLIRTMIYYFLDNPKVIFR